MQEDEINMTLALDTLWVTCVHPWLAGEDVHEDVWMPRARAL